MSNKPASKNVNPPVSYLAKNGRLQLFGRLICPQCEIAARTIDAEWLDPGLRIHCQRCQGDLITLEPPL
jgi:hypothetical protein